MHLHQGNNMIPIIHVSPIRSLPVLSFVLVLRQELCRPKVSLLEASTVARRKFSFSDYRPTKAYTCSNDQLAARRDSSSLISTRISWRRAKNSFLSTTQIQGKPTHQPHERLVFISLSPNLLHHLRLDGTSTTPPKYSKCVTRSSSRPLLI